jgi:hypothetical protein
MIVEPRIVLGMLDIAGAFAVVWSMQRITTRAGFCDAQAIWALVRRGIYCLMATALFGLGIDRFFGGYTTELFESVLQGMLLVSIITFPMLRALGWITQDRLVDGERWHGLGRRDNTEQRQ